MEYILGAAIIGLFVFMFFIYNTIQKQMGDIKGQEKDNESIDKRLEMMRQMMDSMREQVDKRLKENVEVIQREHRNVGERLDNAAKAYTKVDTHLAKMEESNKRIYDVGKDISSLQELLKAPKIRGGLGESFLNDLLAQILPTSHFTMQYTFKSGEKVDAVIHVRDQHLIPVDSKFPLENFKKMMESEVEEENLKCRKMFISDVKKRIDEISTKYILPDEKTLDFALMYVPAENVYYEMIIKDQKNEGNLMNYAFSKKVIPVSPNTFYIYLQTIMLGLKGMQVEKQAKEIMASLYRLRGDFKKFGTDFSLVGTHLGRAKNSFESSEKRLERFGDKLEQVESLSGSHEEVQAKLLD